MCRITPGEKLACVAFLAPLAMTIPRFLDFSRGKIRYDIVWISPGEKCAPVAFLPGRNSHVSHFSQGETRMCCSSPREKSHAVWSCSAGHVIAHG
jgi:hypothetical protein